MFNWLRIMVIIPWLNCMNDLKRGRWFSRTSGAGSFSPTPKMSSLETLVVRV